MIWKKKSICKTKLLYCLKCGKSIESKNSKVVGTKNGRKMLLTKYALCEVKNLYL